MSEFEKGQIVYVSYEGEGWFLMHFAGMSYSTGRPLASTSYLDAITGKGDFAYDNCLSVEDYHKMLNNPEDKDLVYAWDNTFSKTARRAVCFYDAINDATFSSDYKRNGCGYENYEVIPEEHWPMWAFDVIESLED